MKISKKIVLIIMNFLFSLFLIAFFLIITDGNFDAAYIQSSSKYEAKDFVKYISSNKEVKKSGGVHYFKVLDENNIVFSKIHYLNKDLYGVLGKGNGKNYIYTINLNGEIKQKLLVGGNEVDFYDFTYFDGSLILVGKKEERPYVLSMSENGEKLWSKIYNTGGRFNVIKNNSNDFIIAGYISNKMKKQAYISEINISGGIVWESEYGREDNEEINDFIIEPNDIIAVGDTNSNPKKQYDVLVLKYSREGIRLYSNAYGKETQNEYGLSAFSEGSLYVGGYVIPINQNAWKTFTLKTVKGIEEDGSIKAEWFEVRNVKKMSRIIEIKSINEKIYATGFCLDTWPDYDGFLRIIEKNSNFYYMGIYGSSKEERFYSFEEAKDGGIIMVGYQKNGDIVKPLVVKTNSNGRLPGYEK